jgi:hypothetical protein
MEEEDSLNEKLKELYGLAEDPFGLTTPPAYGAKLWCFIDRTLRESTDDTLLRVMRPFVDRIKNRGAGNRGLLIVGGVGTGKTHALNEVDRMCRDLELKTVTIDGNTDRDRITGDIFKSMFNLACERKKGVEIERWDNREISDAMDGTIICIDQSENFVIDHGEDEFIKFFEKVAGLLEYLASQNHISGVIITLVSERLHPLKARSRFSIDRFDKAIFADDMSLIEGIDLIKKNLSLVRIRDVENELLPFTKDSVYKILDIWRTETRTIRVFREKCSKVLRSATRAEIREIDELSAANYIHELYGLWEKCLFEWKSLKQKHRTLEYALFNILDKCKDAPDVKYDDIATEVTYELPSGDKIRNDLLVVPHDRLPVPVEIERGQISKQKYRNILELINRDEYSGIVIVTSSIKEYLFANRIAMGILKDASRYDVIRIREEVLSLGRCLAFAALSPELNFPRDDNCRKKLQQSLETHEALDLIDTLKIKTAIDTVARLRP